MKKSILFPSLLLLVVSGLSCLKDKSCLNKTVESEDAAMQAYATANSITATRHSSGMYYQIMNPGTGTPATLTSSVSVRYVGKLTNGTVFDQATNPTALYPVSGFIYGWQLGLPLINEGGTIKLIIPSSLAYGCSGAEGGLVPANSILYFEVELVDVQ